MGLLRAPHPDSSRQLTRRHLFPVLFFAALAIAWTWPLVLHLTTAIPGLPGDNYSFLWDFWWMRHVLATPSLTFFRTAHLFAPYGTSLVNHSNTALPALIGATLLRSVSVGTAQNILLLAYVFANGVLAYALAWQITRHRRAAVFAGVLFGTSPYLGVHFPGHFELMAAWLLPAFALAFRPAVGSGSRIAAVVSGLLLAATAYTVYYYVVYLGLFALAYLVAWSDGCSIDVAPRPPTARALLARRVLVGIFTLLAIVALWMVMTGGAIWRIGPYTILAREPQNTLTVMWIVATSWALVTWRIRFRVNALPAWMIRRIAILVATIAVVFVAATLPIIWNAAQVVSRGEYVSPVYGWRSIPRGADLAGPLLGSPRHPLFGGLSARAYAATGIDAIEAIAWLGIVPLVLLLRLGKALNAEARLWRAVLVAAVLWAAGPFLTVGGFDTGLRLPEILMRYVPLVANARMPGRAMVLGYLAIAMLLAMRLAEAKGTWQRGAVQWLLIGILGFEYFDAPVPMTLLDRPAVYEQLARMGPGSVCEVPFGMGDGLSAGVGSQDRSVLYYATIHQHPLVGGYVSRLPLAAAGYQSIPLTRALLSLSSRDNATPAEPFDPAGSPCTYLVVKRAALSEPLGRYLATLPMTLLARDETRELYKMETTR